jgi:hypothetical protein
MPLKPPHFLSSVPITNAQTQSPLFNKLPAELRTTIFELAVIDDGYVEAPVDRKNRPATSDEVRKAMIPSIAQACRLARRETLQPFLSMNHFLLDTHHMDAQQATKKWLYAMRPYLTSIRSITFKLSTWIIDT